MAQNLLLEVFCTAVQTFLSAGRTQGGKCSSVSKGRFEDAVGCLREDMDGAGGGIISDFACKNREFGL